MSAFQAEHAGSIPVIRSMETFVSFSVWGCTQVVEGSGPENRKDGNHRKSSNLFAPAINRGVAQLVECLFWEQDAAGSSPVTSTMACSKQPEMFRFLIPMYSLRGAARLSPSSTC